MKRFVSIHAPLALVVLLTSGCATSSKPMTTATASTDAYTSDSRSARSDSSPPERWNYDSLPTPSPSRRPDRRLNEIAFADNSIVLDREGVAVCRLTATQMTSMTGVRFLLVGFSHKTEADPGLGLRRADAVRKCLTRDGIAASRFETASFGSQFSEIPNSPHPYSLTAAQGVEIWTLGTQ